MADPVFKTALIVGAGEGISASVARRFASAGMTVGVASRHVERLDPLAEEIGGAAFEVDAANPRSVEDLFGDVDRRIGMPDVVVYNAGTRVRGPLINLNPLAVKEAIEVTAFGGFLVAQQAARRMLPRKHGAILFTGATAGIKGFAQSAGFAMGKFALRGLAQSVARELGPQGIHVVHFVIDGVVRSASRPEDPLQPDGMLDPDTIAQTYLNVLSQHRSAWSQEVELRSWLETF